MTVQPMVELRRLRADPRQQPRPAVRPGAAVRRGRAAGRGLPGPRAGAAAAEHHPGPADDGADADLRGAAGRPRPARRSTWPRWSSCWSASASWSSSSRGSRRSTSTRCSPRRERLIALDARVVAARRRTSPTTELPRPGHPPLSRRSTSAPWTHDGRDRGHDPPDPAGGRAADGRASTRRSREQSVHLRYFHAMQARASASRTSG